MLARYAREGVQVHLIVASNGDRALEPTPSFCVLSRSQPAKRWGKCELKKPAAQRRALGANPPILLGFPDGKLGDYISDRTLVYRLTDRIAAEIQRLRPDALITWGRRVALVIPITGS